MGEEEFEREDGPRDERRDGWCSVVLTPGYLLSKKEGRVGGPERPLSGLGEVTYKRYWGITVLRYLKDAVEGVTIEGEFGVGVRVVWLAAGYGAGEGGKLDTEEITEEL